jgi:hypothetical protein
MWYSQNNGLDTIHSNLALFAADVFFDQPINKEKGTAITAYGSFSSNNYGKNYVRNLGVMNPANGTDANGSYNGAGDALPLMGTGTTAYLQVGYLLKQNLLGKLGTLQFYGASQYSNFDLLKDPMLMYELGANWLLEQHRYKISFNYQNRPIYTLNSAGDWKATDRKAMFVLQFQIAI